MKFYVDFDDCLSETGRTFSKLAAEMFGIFVPYEEIRFFELDEAFGLNQEQFEQLMIRGHLPEELLAYEETPGASAVINEWIDQGHEVSVITGRPFSSYEPSREWLDRHGFQRAGLYCFDKYARDSSFYRGEYSLTPEVFYKMKFDFAVEDSPKAFRFFDHLPDVRVCVFDRPWNRACEFPDGKYTRCFSWEDIRRIVAENGDKE